MKPTSLFFFCALASPSAALLTPNRLRVEYMTEPPTLEELKQRTTRSAEYLETEAEVLRLLDTLAFHQAIVFCNAKF